MTSLCLAALLFFAGVLTARILTLDDRGRLAGVVAIANLAAALGQLGLGQGIAFTHRSVPEGVHTKIRIGSLCLVALLSSGFGWVLAYPMGRGDAVVISVLSFWCGAAAFTYATSQAQKSLSYFNTQRLLIPLLVFLGVLVVALSHGAFRALTWVYIFANMAGALFGIIALFRIFPKPLVHGVSATRGTILKKSRDFYAASVLGIIIINLDRIYLSYWSNLGALGLYSVAFGFSRIFGTAFEAVGIALYTHQLGALETVDGMRSQMARTLRIFTRLIAPALLMAVLFAFFAQELVRMIYGAEYANHSLLFVILTFEALVGGGGWILGQSLLATGHTKVMVQRQLFLLALLAVAFSLLGRGASAEMVAEVVLGLSFVKLLVTLALVWRSSRRVSII